MPSLHRRRSGYVWTARHAVKRMRVQSNTNLDAFVHISAVAFDIFRWCYYKVFVSTYCCFHFLGLFNICWHRDPDFDYLTVQVLCDGSIYCSSISKKLEFVRPPFVVYGPFLVWSLCDAVSLTIHPLTSKTHNKPRWTMHRMATHAHETTKAIRSSSNAADIFRPNWSTYI